MFNQKRSSFWDFFLGQCLHQNLSTKQKKRHYQSGTRMSSNKRCSSSLTSRRLPALGSPEASSSYILFQRFLVTLNFFQPIEFLMVLLISTSSPLEIPHFHCAPRRPHPTTRPQQRRHGQGAPSAPSAVFPRAGRVGRAGRASGRRPQGPLKPYTKRCRDHGWKRNAQEGELPKAMFLVYINFRDCKSDSRSPSWSWWMMSRGGWPCASCQSFYIPAHADSSNSCPFSTEN